MSTEEIHVHQTSSAKLPSPPFALHPSVKDRLDPEYRAFFDKYLSDNAAILYTHLIPLDQIRAGGNVIPGQSPKLPVASTSDIAIARRYTTGDSSVPARVFVPTGTAPHGGWPVTVWFHGGGWVLGNIDTENSFCTHVAEWSRCVVVSVDYRLAPEDPFPACIDDAQEALMHVMEQGIADGIEINTSKVAVAGSSAGGNIAAVLAHRYPEWKQGKDLPELLYQVLVVPVCDNTADVETHLSWREFELTPQLPRDKMMWYRRHYLKESEYTDPDASPIFFSEQSFKKNPPALICCGECDVLRTEGEEYAAKLKQAGVETDLVIYPGMPHPVMAMDDVLTQGKRLVSDAAQALKKAFYESA